MITPRQAFLTLEYDGKDISSDIRKDVENFTYTDSGSDSSDSLSIKVNAMDHKWIDSWMPDKEAVLHPTLCTTNWIVQGDRTVLDCGTLVVDDLSFSACPDVLTIGAVARPNGTSFHEKNREQVWKNTSIKRIAETIAGRYGLECKMDAEDVSVALKEQDDNDSSFLQKICSTYGLILKTYRNKIWIFDREKYKKKASLVHGHLMQKGVKLYLGQAVEAFERTDAGLGVTFKSGIRLQVDMVILSIGVRAETRLASEAGLKLGEMKGIYVNEYLQTSDEAVYAVGDAIEFPHPVTGKPWLNFLAGPANRQARIVADNIVFGNKAVYEGSIGTSIAKVFDMTVASAGLPAKRLKQMGIAYLSSTTHSASHAGYYPGALQMAVKVVFSPQDGKLYGAQIVGYDGVDKRIDEFALVIKQGGTVYDLTRLEHAYAPPFSSAKDPVAIAGYVAGNILSGKMTPLYWRELRDADLSRVTLVDVRTQDEFELGAIPGAVNMPLDELREHLDEIPRDKPVWVYCGVGLRGYLASNILKGHGFKEVRNLAGGIKTYKAAVTPVELPSEGTACVSAGGEKDSGTDMQPDKVIKVNACGVQCPGPILKLKQGMEALQPGQCLEVSATDAGFPRDAEAWCRTTGNRFLSKTEENGVYRVRIEKAQTISAVGQKTAVGGKGKTFILFSDDLDKTLATFVLANGAAATGEKVTVFFTFWGLNAIKKEQKPKVRKDIFGKMFGMMLPSDSRKLKLSKMNMGGIGSKMMRYVMKQKGVDSLESLRQQAIANGVEFIACQMSMDVMGIKREELLDCVTIGGVATYMDRAGEANMNLFI